jgi:hypothetical protein
MYNKKIKNKQETKRGVIDFLRNNIRSLFTRKKKITPKDDIISSQQLVLTNEELLSKDNFIKEFTKFIEKKQYHTKWKVQCDISISINYKDRFVGNIIHYSEYLPPDTIVLCLYKNNDCVSSMELTIDHDSHIISFNSITQEDKRGNKYNKLLRCIFFLFFKNYDVYKDYRIHVQSASRITEWIMINYFGFEPVVSDIDSEHIDFYSIYLKNKIKSFKAYNDFYNKYKSDNNNNRSIFIDFYINPGDIDSSKLEEKINAFICTL